MLREEILRRIEEKARLDRQEGWMLLVLSVPFTFFSLFLINVVGFMLAMWLVGYDSIGAAMLAINGVGIVAMAFDTWLHPTEKWERAQYFLVRGEDNPIRLETDSGLPLMMSVTDPQNLATMGRTSVSAAANVILAGPRTLRKAIEQFIVARRRTSAAVVRATEEMIFWLESRGDVPYEDVAAHLSVRRDLLPGLVMGEDLLLIKSRYEQGRRIYTANVISM